MLPEASATSYRYQQGLTLTAVAAAERAWRRVSTDDLDASWLAVRDPLAMIQTGLQIRAAEDSAGMVPAVLDEMGTPVDPVAEVHPSRIAGVSSQGYSIAESMDTSVIHTKALIGRGVKPAEALAMGGTLLTLTVQTSIQDVARQSSALAIYARPKVGYVRMLNPPSCSRCAVLAGKPSRREPFLRHPRCDCRAIPSMEDLYTDVTFRQREYFDSLTGAEQDRIFTKAGARAIRDGADMGQVVNARRGMSRAQTPGTRKWLVTREGTSRRGRAGWRMHQAGLGDYVKAGDGSRYRRLTAQRLMPETIYDIARDDAHAIELLKVYGYMS